MMEKLDKMDISLAEILGIENEYEISKQAKTPAEIEKWCTKEDLTEVKRCVHLMKKGYEIQKVSVINNLDRYMQEAGANEELFSLIVDSLMDWDDKMQKECAYSFVKPLQMDVVNKRNKEKTVKAAVAILTDDDNAENEELLTCWIKVLETVVSRVDIKYISEHVTKAMKDIPGLKNPLVKRKRGNRLIFAVAKNIGEKNIDKDPYIMKLIYQICQDNNYKIRRDGVVFLKEYILESRDEVIASERFKDVYLPQLVDFLNDEDLHIQIDAIEAVNEILEYLEKEQIEEDFLPCIINFLDSENQSQIEITERISKMFGPIVYKLQKVGLHLKYKEELINYYKQISKHKDEIIRQSAVYNLPCINSLFKHQQESLNINFYDMYVKFSEDESPDIRECAVKSLHEAFAIVEDGDNTSKIRKFFIECIVDDQKEIMSTMNSNLDVIILKWGNQHTIDNFKGRTPYIDTTSDPSSKESTPKANSNTDKDFSSSITSGEKSGKRKGLTKKNTHLGINIEPEEDNLPKLPPIYVTDEYKSELVYSDLLQRLMVFYNNIRNNTGMWREHVKLLKNLVNTIHLFYMPEVHQYIVPMLIDFIYKGNKEIKDGSCNCLAKILKYQHHTPSRDQLLQIISKELAHASSWSQRRAFIYFCRWGVHYLPRDFFKKHFLQDYLKASKDKVPHVRMEFANTLLFIKPYFDSDTDSTLQMMDILNHMSNDSDRDVLEAVEHTDYELLQMRKKNKNLHDKDDAEKCQFQKQLVIREKQELEERKKRVEDEEEIKYDMASFLAESKRWRQKATKYTYNKRPFGSFSSSRSLLSGTGMGTIKKINTNGMADSDNRTPIKKKSTMTIKKQSTNQLGDLDFAKQRKNSALLGQTKEDQIKRYHAMVSGNASTNGNKQNSNSKTVASKVRRNTTININGNSGL